MADATRADRLGAALLGVGTAIALAAWPGWHLRDTPAADAYVQDPAAFVAAAEAFAAAHGQGEREGVPLVAPPPGADVPVMARRFQFWPALRLQAGRTYRLHVSSVDTVHSVVVNGRELALIPGEVRVVKVTAVAGMPAALQCGEYCGLGHTRMRTGIEVVP